MQKVGRQMTEQKNQECVLCSARDMTFDTVSFLIRYINIIIEKIKKLVKNYFRSDRACCK